MPIKKIWNYTRLKLTKNRNGIDQNQKNQSRNTSSKDGIHYLCCYQKKSKSNSILINSKETDRIENYSPVLYDRESKNQWSASLTKERPNIQPFLNYNPHENYRTSLTDTSNYKSVLVDFPSFIEQDKSTGLVTNKSTSPLHRIFRRDKNKNIAECKITTEDQKLLYTSPTYYEVVTNPESNNTFNESGSVDIEKEVVEKMRWHLPKSYQGATSETYQDFSPDNYEREPSEVGQYHFPINSKHCVACLIESMRNLPECCLKKALYLNPVYISNDCPSNPVYIQ